MGIIATLVIGGLAGWITGMLMKGGGYGVIGDIILGIIGGFVGGFLTSVLLGVNMMTGFNVTSLIVAIIGAVIVVAIARLLRGQSVR